MTPRARRVVFGLLVLLLGTLALSPLVLVEDLHEDLLFLGFLTEVVVIFVGVGIAVTEPPVPFDVRAPRPAAPEPLGPSTAYRGALPPAHASPISKSSAIRLTIGILAALAFTAAAVPFALHLPKWVEAEIVVGTWWTIWSVVLAVVAYRGTKVVDDHQPSGTPVVDFGEWPKPKARWLLEGLGDPEGCLIVLAVLAVLGVALLGAWLVVELVAPAVFIVAYRGVVRALAKAHAAQTRGDAVRSAVSGMGWAALGTAPLAMVVALVHLIAIRAS